MVSEVTLGEDAKLVYAQPHMHLRGKDFELRVVSPNGESKTVLKGDWNFEWQIGLPVCGADPDAQGLEAPADQSFRQFRRATAFNPDATKKVVWGPQNWDEMSNCFIGVIFGTDIAARESVPEIRSQPVAEG